MRLRRDPATHVSEGQLPQPSFRLSTVHVRVAHGNQVQCPSIRTGRVLRELGPGQSFYGPTSPKLLHRVVCSLESVAYAFKISLQLDPTTKLSLSSAKLNAGFVFPHLRLRCKFFHTPSHETSFTRGNLTEGRTATAEHKQRLLHGYLNSMGPSRPYPYGERGDQ